MTTRRTFGLFAALLAAAAGVAQEPKAAPPSTAKPGEVVPATFRAYVAADDRFPPKVNPPLKPDDRDPRDRTAKVHCLVCENGLSPVVAVFVRGHPKDVAPDGGVAKLAKALDAKIPDYRADRLAGFVAFLNVEGPAKTVTVTNAEGATTAVVELDAEYPDDEKRDEYATAIRDLAAATKTPNVPFALAPAASKAAAAWGLGADDQVTVVIYNRLRVVNRWKFDAAGPTDDQVKEIVAAAEEMITGVKKAKE